MNCHALIQISELDKILKGDSNYEALHVLHSAHGYLPSMEGMNIHR